MDIGPSDLVAVIFSGIALGVAIVAYFTARIEVQRLATHADERIERLWNQIDIIWTEKPKKKSCG